MFEENKAGSQKRIIHQYSVKLPNISDGIIPKIAATKKPTNPDKTLREGDQNLYKISDITHKAIETPNKSRLIPIMVPKKLLSKEKEITI